MSVKIGTGISGVWPWRGLLVLVLAGLVSMGSAQAAPSKKELADEIAGLRAELAQLRKDFDAFRQKVELPESATRLLGDLVVRMERIERQLATLNGRVEEQEHALAELNTRFAHFAADVQTRLVKLESGAPASAPATQAKEGEGAAEEPAGTASAAGPQAETEETAGNPHDDASSSPAAEGGAAAAKEPEIRLPDDPRQAYDAAFSLLRQGDFAGAERAFAAFLKAFPTHPLAANAQYWLGETFYVRKDYAHAAEAFLKGYQNYRDRPKAADSLLKLAMSLAALGNKQEACAALAELSTRFPNASRAVRQRASAQRQRLACP